MTRFPSGRRAAAALLVLGLAFGVAVATGAAAAQTTLQDARAGGAVTLAIAGEAPYGYEGAGGRATGEAPEIARVILSRIAPEAEARFVETAFGELIPALRAGDADIAAAGMFVTPERCAHVAFSNPTYVVGEAFAVRRGNPEGLTDYATASDHPDARIGLVAGTVEYNYALVAGIPADRAPLYRSFEHAIAALAAGEVDAVGLTALTARSLVADRPALEATPQFFPEIDGQAVKGYGAFAFRKEDEALVAAFDAALADFLGTPEHLALVAPFGFGADMLPDRTTEALCAEG